MTPEQVQRRVAEEVERVNRAVDKAAFERIYGERPTGDADPWAWDIRLEAWCRAMQHARETL